MSRIKSWTCCVSFVFTGSWSPLFGRGWHSGCFCVFIGSAGPPLFVGCGQYKNSGCSCWLEVLSKSTTVNSKSWKMLLFNRLPWSRVQPQQLLLSFCMIQQTGLQLESAFLPYAHFASASFLFPDHSKFSEGTWMLDIAVALCASSEVVNSLCVPL